MFQLPKLQYDYGDLGAYISKDIMELHHNKHHQAYVDKLNTAIEQLPDLRDESIEDILLNLEAYPESVRSALRNHGGGHYNHTLFWKWMNPHGGGEPRDKLGRDIQEKYGNFQTFVDEFTAKSLSVFGSGWCWLQPDLEIITTANQDTPIMQGLDEPLLGLDVWEHAYYLDYKNKRNDYVAAWWNVVDWEFVSDRYNAQR